MSPRLQSWYQSSLRYVVHLLWKTVRVLFFLIVLALVTFVLRKTIEPYPLDYSELQFNWPRIEPNLRPWNRTFGNYSVLLDAHRHTTVSDGKLSPEQAVDLAYVNGYNAVAITDHNTVMGARLAKAYAEQKYPGKMLVISGMEWTTCRIHLNFLGINETIKPPSAWPTDVEIKAAIDQVHQKGGLVTLNHIAWSNKTNAGYNVPTLPNHPALDKLLEMGIDGVEVVSGEGMDGIGYSFYLDHQDRLYAVTGSDMHNPGPAIGWTVLNPSEFSERAVLAELKRRKTSFLYDFTGTPVRVNVPIASDWLRWAPLTTIHDYFSNYYEWTQGMYGFAPDAFCQPPIFAIHWWAIFWGVVWLIGLLCLFDLACWAYKAIYARYLMFRNPPRHDSTIDSPFCE